MRKIKDFIYNTSDILAAILIVVIALLLILWRVDVIVSDSSNNDDPGIFKTAAARVVLFIEDITGKDLGIDLGVDFESDGQDNFVDISEEKNNDTNNTNDNQNPEENTPPSSFILIVSEGDTALDIAEKLAAQGAITDSEYFANLITISGKPINPGAYTILSGLTPEQIVEDITK